LANKIDKEVSGIVNKTYSKSKEMLNKNINYLHRVAEKLIEQEIISNKYLITLMDVLFEACTVIPAVDYLHTFRKDLSETPYYQDVYPN